MGWGVGETQRVRLVCTNASIYLLLAFNQVFFRLIQQIELLKMGFYWSLSSQTLLFARCSIYVEWVTR